MGKKKKSILLEARIMAILESVVNGQGFWDVDNVSILDLHLVKLLGSVCKNLICTLIASTLLCVYTILHLEC